MKENGEKLISRKTEVQPPMELMPTKELEIDGIGMGVLGNGTAYLTARGFSRICGIDDAEVIQLATDWAPELRKPRATKISSFLHDQGYEYDSLSLSITVDGSTHHGFPDKVCMALLEYYAFEVVRNCREQAARNYRVLARSSLRAFIYTQVCYDPLNRIPEHWSQFHERVTLNYDVIPAGYFSIFKENSDITVSLIRDGLPVDQNTVPDIGLGQAWGKYWSDKGLDGEYGRRIPYQPNHPEIFPQAASNPIIPWAFPEEALPDFRKWMREAYLPDKFPAFRERQEKRRALPPSIKSLILKDVLRQTIPGREDNGVGLQSEDFRDTIKRIARVNPERLG